MAQTSCFKASKKFNNVVEPDSDRPLENERHGDKVVQLSGSGMRIHAPEEPKGGILGDVMGIGKTLQALVNIVDGHPLDPGDPIRTTLLIVPSHLTKHW
ncbi:uncharacterized protein BDV17DRAFT_288773 [Aspergillus undulatus]|uniref:uncharacterized protein n=1 Tax=Aspergillus undulatus TaxID=1810928 RepID=UPI003CCDA663